MSTIAKMIGIKYPRSIIDGRKSEILDIINKDLIKNTISEYLFIENYDYVLINYEGKLHVCEKKNAKEYSRREILYHPLMNDLKII